MGSTTQPTSLAGKPVSRVIREYQIPQRKTESAGQTRYAGIKIDGDVCYISSLGLGQYTALESLLVYNARHNAVFSTSRVSPYGGEKGARASIYSLGGQKITHHDYNGDGQVNQDDTLINENKRNVSKAEFEALRSKIRALGVNV